MIGKVRALQLSFIAISSAIFIEGIIGFLVNSLAILGDASHAIFDAITTLILLSATQISLKPPDEEHMYGHEKMESIGGLVGGITLLALAGFLVTGSVIKIMWGGSPVIPEPIGFVAVGYTLCVDFFRIGTLTKVKTEGSVTVRANLFHAVSDFASTIIALLGFGLATIGLPKGDPIASIILGSSLAYISTKLIRSSAMELSDAISPTVAREVKKQILGAEGVLECRELKVRKVGAKTYVEAEITVPDSMGLKEAHNLTSKIESEIIKSLGNATITVHIEPESKGISIERKIENLANVVQGVKGVHDVSSIFMDGKLYIVLHAKVKPQLPLEEAHTIAEKIEDIVEQEISNVENITVHIEPFTTEARRGCVIDEAEIREIIKCAVKDYLKIFKLNRIVTYADEKQRYINIDCSFSRTASVDLVHDIVSDVEKVIKEKFEETIVTIHPEPKKSKRQLIQTVKKRRK